MQSETVGSVNLRIHLLVVALVAATTIVCIHVKEAVQAVVLGASISLAAKVGGFGLVASVVAFLVKDDGRRELVGIRSPATSCDAAIVLELTRLCLFHLFLLVEVVLQVGVLHQHLRLGHNAINWCKPAELTTAQNVV